MSGLAIATVGRAYGDAQHAVGEELGKNDGVWIRRYRENADPPIPVACAWCALAIQAWSDWTAKLLGVPNPLDAVKLEALVASYYAWAEAAGKLVTPVESRAGDLVLFKFASPAVPAPPWNHIGLVARKIDLIHIRTVEGNTSPGVGETTAEREREGDGVYVKDRIVTRQPIAFVRWSD